MEIMVLLKLEIDPEHLKEGNDTDINLQSKIRHYIADLVGTAVAKQEYMALLSSALVTIKDDGIIQIQDSNRVIRLPDKP